MVRVVMTAPTPAAVAARTKIDAASQVVVISEAAQHDSKAAADRAAP